MAGVETRAAACRQLAELSGGDVRRYAGTVKAHADDLRPSELGPHVIRLILSEDAQARAIGSSILWESGRDGELANAVAIAINHQLCGSHLVWLIQQIEPEHVYACHLLSELRSHPEPRVRIAALEAMVRVARDKAARIPDLVEVVRDERDTSVRVAAVRLLGNLGPSTKQAVPLLRTVLNGGGDLHLKLEAARSWQRMEPDNSVQQHRLKRIEVSIQHQISDAAFARIASEIQLLVAEQDDLRERTRKASRNRTWKDLLD